MKRLKVLATLVMLITICLGEATLAFAGTTLNEDAIKYLQEHAPGGTNGKGDWAKNVEQHFKTEADEKYISEIVIGDKVYFFNPEEADSINARVRKINELADINSTVDDITGGFNIKADTEQATEILSPLSKPLSIFIGIMVSLITVFMTIFSAFDICYIVFPVFRDKVTENKNAGGIMAKPDGNGGTTLRFVTDEAVNAVLKSAEGKNAMIEYFKHRVANYVILAIMLFILITGNISLITNLALKLVSGILSVIQELT